MLDVVIISVLIFLLTLYLWTLICRLVLDWIQVFARQWRPRGPVLLFAEAIYSITDPPLKFLRRLIPPLSLGSIRLDIAFLVLILAVSLSRGVLESLGRSI